MPIADGIVITIDPGDSDQIKAEKKAAQAIVNRLARFVKTDDKRIIDNLNENVSYSGATKATVMAHLGADEAEANAIIGDIITTRNAHKPTGDPDLVFDGTWEE